MNHLTEILSQPEWPALLLLAYYMHKVDRHEKLWDRYYFEKRKREGVPQNGLRCRSISGRTKRLYTKISKGLNQWKKPRN